MKEMKKLFKFQLYFRISNSYSVARRCFPKLIDIVMFPKPGVEIY